MHAFWTDHLVLDKQLVYFFVGKNISPTLRVPQSPVASCAGLRSPYLYPVYLARLLLRSLLSSCLGSHVGGTWCVCLPSDIPRRHNFRENSLFFWLLESFCPLFSSDPWAGCVWELTAAVSAGADLHSSAVRLLRFSVMVSVGYREGKTCLIGCIFYLLFAVDFRWFLNFLYLNILFWKIFMFAELFLFFYSKTWLYCYYFMS